MTDTVIIDDDAFFCENVQKLFQRSGMSIEAVTSSKAALSRDFSDVKVVLLDIDMPHASGLDLLPHLKSFPGLVVIMVSGAEGFAPRLEALEKGADFFMSKPVLLEEMRLVVQRALERQSAPKESVWSLSLSTQQMTCPDGSQKTLTSAEFALLRLLILAGQRPVSRAELIASGLKLDGDWQQFQHRLEVIVSRMRARLSNDRDRLPVRSLRSEGYVFDGEGEIAA